MTAVAAAVAAVLRDVGVGAVETLASAVAADGPRNSVPTTSPLPGFAQGAVRVQEAQIRRRAYTSGRARSRHRTARPGGDGIASGRPARPRRDRPGQVWAAIIPLCAATSVGEQLVGEVRGMDVNLCAGLDLAAEVFAGTAQFDRALTARPRAPHS